MPDFNVALRILPITEGFDCPDDLEIVLLDGASDTMVTLPANATLTPMVDHIVISNNLLEYNPMTPGAYTITWTLSDDLGNAMTTCEQIVTVDYVPCLGVSYQGYDYDAVRVGSQCWLAENLRWATGNHKAYNEDASNVEKFGYLYSWYTAMGVTEGNDGADFSHIVIILYTSVAASTSETLLSACGQSSTTSKPVTFLLRNTFSKKERVGYHCSPPGSGVPVAGSIDGSKPSKSTVI